MKEVRPLYAEILYPPLGIGRPNNFIKICVVSRVYHLIQFLDDTKDIHKNFMKEPIMQSTLNVIIMHETSLKSNYNPRNKLETQLLCMKQACNVIIMHETSLQR